jgi:hypothetical protein
MDWISALCSWICASRGDDEPVAGGDDGEPVDVVRVRFDKTRWPGAFADFVAGVARVGDVRSQRGEDLGEPEDVGVDGEADDSGLDAAHAADERALTS